MQQTLNLVLCGVFSIFFNFLSFSQVYQSPSEKKYTVGFTNELIKIDGNLNETVWANAPLLDSFYNKWPVDQGKAANTTDVKLLYDKSNIYIAVKANIKGKKVIQTLKRDGDSYWLGDGVMILFDAMNRRAQSLGFAVNAGGAQLDGINQTGAPMNFNWDGKWYSAVKQYSDYYVAEIMIPLKTFRYNIQNDEWGFNVLRNDMSNNTYSTWTNVPVAFDGVDMGFFGSIKFEQGLSASKKNHAVIPFVTGSAAMDKSVNPKLFANADAGMDVKVSVTSTMVMDVTLNPDFSQVDVDRQVLNFDRFELFFPERRNFFLENSDLFANYGSDNIRPFFSRRIGIGANGQQTPILGGVRLTGNVTKDSRLGLMNIITGAIENSSRQNIAIASFEQRVLKRSNVRALVTHRQALNSTEKLIHTDANKYNAVAGGEFNYTSNTSKYMGNLRYFRSVNPGNPSQSSFVSGRMQYITKKWWLNLMLDDVGKNFITDVGFVPRLNNYDAARDTVIRLGYRQLQANAQYRIFPKSGKISQDIYELWPTLTLNTNNSLNELNIYVRKMIVYRNSAFLEAGIRTTVIQLPFETSFFPKTGNVKQGKYNFSNIVFNYYSNARQKINYDAGIDAGGFYNGYRIVLNGAVRYRTQPWGLFGIRATQGFIELNNKQTTTLLIGPTAEINFSSTMFWTTFLQYNTQANNFNINSRFQWRFKPLSDLFIVYTDNYTTGSFVQKNRMLVLKLNYWFSL